MNEKLQKAQRIYNVAMVYFLEMGAQNAPADNEAVSKAIIAAHFFDDCTYETILHNVAEAAEHLYGRLVKPV